MHGALSGAVQELLRLMDVVEAKAKPLGEVRAAIPVDADIRTLVETQMRRRRPTPKPRFRPTHTL